MSLTFGTPINSIYMVADADSISRNTVSAYGVAAAAVGTVSCFIA